MHNKTHIFNYRIKYTIVKDIDFYDLVLKYIVPIRPGREDKRKMRAKTFVSFIYRVA